MRYWYYSFEGVFTEKSINFGDGVFSNCLIPESNHQKAKKMFLSTLKENQIYLIEIIDYFSIDGEELDPEDENNSFWIELYKKTQTENKPVFDTWHLFKLDGKTN